MQPWVLAVIVLVTVQTGVTSQDLENCTICDHAIGCPAGDSDCYLHCDYACPIGYNSANASDVCTSESMSTRSMSTGTDVEDLTQSFMSSTPPMSSSFMSSTPPMSSSFMSSTPTVIESSTELGTPSATPSPTMGPQKQFQCWKCQVANCSSCPEDQFNTSCTECMEGFELVSQNSTSRKDRCVPDGTGGDGGGDTTPLVDTGDGGGGGSSSLNKGAVAGGVVAGGVAVLVVAAVIIVLLWRRRKATSGKEVMMSMMKAKKKQKQQDSDEEERSESRYTKSPVGSPIRDPPSMGTEISEVNKLPIAPGIPQENYDALELNRQNSVQPYGKLELNPGQESVYGNKFAIDQASKNSVYANSHVTGTDNTGDDGPSEIYGNEEVLQSQGQGQGQEDGFQEAYMDMSGHRSQEVYNNDLPPSQDDTYLNQPEEATQDEVYINQGAELEEENVYRNT
ncbi:hypothetical protein RRG08_052633 [Elysia crispata]|uniref:Membrane anchor Opy2 N-terminal domain-containing protein n=1 Tax=Elysia crispata TaxID=231223 RepID=A0AAE1AH49_9GAST|nr:hypothetical protein RRG08_052633 [Elysia crispata]